MNARIYGGSPWTRGAIRTAAAEDPESLRAVEAAIPAEHHISLFCGSRPRPLGAHLVGPSGTVARVEPMYATVGAACWAVLREATHA